MKLNLVIMVIVLSTIVGFISCSPFSRFIEKSSKRDDEILNALLTNSNDETIVHDSSEDVKATANHMKSSNNNKKPQIVHYNRKYIHKNIELCKNVICTNSSSSGQIAKTWKLVQQATCCVKRNHMKL